MNVFITYLRQRAKLAALLGAVCLVLMLVVLELSASPYKECIVEVPKEASGVAPEGATPSEVAVSVRGIAFGPDGQCTAILSNERQSWMYRTDCASLSKQGAGGPLRLVRQFEFGTRSVSVSSDLQRFLLCKRLAGFLDFDGHLNQLEVWEWKEGHPSRVRRLHGDHFLQSVCLSPNGERVVVQIEKQGCIEVEGDNKVKHISSSNGDPYICVSENGNILLCSHYGRVRSISSSGNSIWEQPAEVDRTFNVVGVDSRGTIGVVYGAHVRPKGSAEVGAVDHITTGRAYAFDAATGKPRFEIPIEFPVVTVARVSPTGQFIALGCGNLDKQRNPLAESKGCCVIVDAESGRATWTRHTDASVSAIGISGDGKAIGFGLADGKCLFAIAP